MSVGDASVGEGAWNGNSPAEKMLRKDTWMGRSGSQRLNWNQHLFLSAPHCENADHLRKKAASLNSAKNSKKLQERPRGIVYGAGGVPQINQQLNSYVLKQTSATPTPTPMSLQIHSALVPLLPSNIMLSFLSTNPKHLAWDLLLYLLNMSFLTSN
jgi:hypothetical protein